MQLGTQSVHKSGFQRMTAISLYSSVHYGANGVGANSLQLLYRRCLFCVSVLPSVNHSWGGAAAIYLYALIG